MCPNSTEETELLADHCNKGSGMTNLATKLASATAFLSDEQFQEAWGIIHSGSWSYLDDAAHRVANAASAQGWHSRDAEVEQLDKQVRFLDERLGVIDGFIRDIADLETKYAGLVLAVAGLVRALNGLKRGRAPDACWCEESNGHTPRCDAAYVGVSEHKIWLQKDA